MEIVEPLLEADPLYVATCDLCQREKLLNPVRPLPSEENGPLLCGDCRLLAFVYYTEARALVARHLPDGSKAATSKQLAAAFEAAYRAGQVFEQAVLLLRSRRPGARAPLASDFAIVLLFLRGVADSDIHALLEIALRDGELTIPRVKGDSLHPGYVKERRKDAVLSARAVLRLYEPPADYFQAENFPLAYRAEHDTSKDSWRPLRPPSLIPS